MGPKAVRAGALQSKTSGARPAAEGPVSASGQADLGARAGAVPPALALSLRNK